MTKEETKEMWDSIEKLSELRSNYSCFDKEEEPYYRALSLGIKGIKALEQNTVSEEVYNDEYIARKQAEYELWKIKEQQPNDDCVSRQAVKEGMRKYGFHAPDMTITEFIEDELPSVTPKIPTSDDYVSLGVYKQVIWERDIAIEQLKELGYGFGEKIRTSDDFVSRADLLAQIKELWEAIETKTDFVNIVKASPSVTPTQCIAAIRFSKEDLKEICDERIEIACEHGTCMNCKHNRPNSYARTMFSCERGNRFKLRDCENFYCADFEKRGNENVSS